MRIGVERIVTEGGGHAPQRTGEPFNSVRRRFLGSVVTAAGDMAIVKSERRDSQPDKGGPVVDWHRRGVALPS